MEPKKPGALTANQARYLGLLLEGKTFTEIRRELGLTKQYSAELLTNLRERELLVSGPPKELTFRERTFTDADRAAGKVVWWTAESGTQYVLTSMVVPQRTRPTEMAHHRRVVLFECNTDPMQQLLLWSTKQRISFHRISAIVPWAVDKLMLRDLTMMTAYLFDQEAVLPPEFLAGEGS